MTWLKLWNICVTNPIPIHDLSPSL